MIIIIIHFDLTLMLIHNHKCRENMKQKFKKNLKILVLNLLYD